MAEKNPKKTQFGWARALVVLAVRLLSSKYFFGLIVAFFLFQMAWIALSAIYPMLFDEEYHLGIIEIYSRQAGPFIATQPFEAAFHGDITRYGSYLFHYLMSGPYWLVSHLTGDLMTQVITLRFVCIGFVLAGLVLWRKFLLRAGLSQALTHTSIGVFTLIPLVPFALAQLNYDSLAFLLVPAVFYLALRAREPGRRQFYWTMLLLSVAPLACLVKFTMLPIVFVAVLFAFVFLWREHGAKLSRVLRKQAQALPRPTVIFLALFFMLAGGLFIERYGVNLAHYRTIEPKCDRLHPREECSQYTVWRRDTTWRASNAAINKPRDSPFEYTSEYWAPHIFNDFFVTGAFVYQEPRELEIRYLPSGPGSLQATGGNKVLRYAGWALFLVALLAVAITWRRLPNKKLRYLVVSTVLVYATALWIRNYTDYLSIGSPTAAQGRYFIPLLIPILAVAGLAFGRLLGRLRNKLVFLALCGLLLTQGGGVMTYMLYSKPNWYWPANNQVIRQANDSAHTLIRSFTPF